MIFNTMLKCPDCRLPLDSHLMGVSSGLGPSVVYCWKCEKPISLGRKEWHEFTVKDRLKFFLISLLYLAGGGLVGAILFGVAYENWMKLKSPESSEFYHTPYFYNFFALAAFLVLVVLAIKIKASLKSQESQEDGENRKHLGLYALDFTLGAQMKLLILFCIPWVVALLKTKFF